MRIYTRTGDQGFTGLSGGARARKSDPRIEALGAVDETNAALGLARAHTREDAVLDLGADLASPGAQGRITPAQIEGLEEAIDRLEADLEPLRAFILPGGGPAAAALHLARTVARRAERALVAMEGAGEAFDPNALAMLNRLSDLLFVAARHANRAAGDVLWRPGL
jgi:cob(I)alamin adenosyltransferase